MTIVPLSIEERAASGFTHKVSISYTDLYATAGLTKTVLVFPSLAAANIGLLQAALRVKTAFVGAAISALTAEVGDDGDTDRILAASSILAAAGTWYAILPATAPAFFGTANTFDVLFTATGANLTALTAGELELFLSVSDLRLTVS
jgi:hypothetical protein